MLGLGGVGDDMCCTDVHFDNPLVLEGVFMLCGSRMGAMMRCPCPGRNVYTQNWPWRTVQYSTDILQPQLCSLFLELHFFRLPHVSKYDVRTLKHDNLHLLLVHVHCIFVGFSYALLSAFCSKLSFVLI